MTASFVISPPGNGAAPVSVNDAAAAAPADAPAVFVAHTQADALRERLRQQPDAWLVACYCAAWCKTCDAWRDDFDALAARWPQHVFAWIDIEERPDLLGDEEIENFPTLLLQQGDAVRFFGTLQPYITHLEGLLQRGERLTAGDAPAPPARALLLDR